MSEASASPNTASEPAGTAFVPSAAALANANVKYRTLFELHPTEDEDALGSVADLVVGWILDKEGAWTDSPVVSDFERYGANPLFWNYSQPKDYHGGDYDLDQWPALATAALFSPDGDEPVIWAVEYDEPVPEHEGCRWRTAISLERIENGACRVAVEVSRHIASWTREEQRPVVVSTPALVRDIVSLSGFEARVGKTAVLTAPCRLTAATFDDFAAQLVSKERTIPLALFCTGFNGKVPEHAVQFARRTLANANTYVLDWSNDELREKLFGLFVKSTPAARYLCLRGSARIYLPGVNLENGKAAAPHRYFPKEQLDTMRPSEFADLLGRELIGGRKGLRVADIGRR